MALVGSVLVPAFLLQHFYEAPDVTVLPRPEPPPPPPYYADYAYEPLGGRPIRVSLNGVEFNLPRGRGMSFSLVLDDEVRRVDFSPRGFERNPYQQQMLAVLEERHDAVPIIGFGLRSFDTIWSPCSPDNGDWNVPFCRAIGDLSTDSKLEFFQWRNSLSVRRNRFHSSPNITGFPEILFGNEDFRRSGRIENLNFSFENGCMRGINIRPPRSRFQGHFCKLLIFHETGFLIKTYYYFNTFNSFLIDDLIAEKLIIISKIFRD